MKKEKESEDGLYFTIYLALIGLTLITAASYYMGFGPILGVVFALGIASMKASLIGYFFMHLKDEPAIICAIVFVGVLAVVILTVGIIPDMALNL